MPIYWLNLDSMPERATSLRSHLDAQEIIYHQRISGLTPETCNLLMYECDCNRVGISDIAILCSHVNALYTVINDKNPIALRSKYFIMLEDDVRFQFKIDFEALISAAPKGFGALQLMMSHKKDIDNHWNIYSSLYNPKTSSNGLFSYRPRNSTVWSAQATLYNKDVVREFLRYAIGYDRKGRLGFKLVNTFDIKKSSYYNQIHTSASKFRVSIFSDCIFADMFLYSMSSPTYILNFPLFNSASLGLNSSSHQSHVKHHIHGFSRIQEIHDSMKKGIYPLPPFLKLLTPSDSITRSSKIKSVVNETVDWKALADNTPLNSKESNPHKIRNG